MADQKTTALIEDISARLKKLEERAAHSAVESENGVSGGAQSQVCAVPELPERTFGPDVSADRAALIRVISKKWVNGTVLHYYFFSGSPWGGAEAQKEVVRQAFKVWKDVGLGLEFEEVDSPEDAEIRIGFLQGNGSWSYVGRDILRQGQAERTMNFGWDLTSPDGIDTAIHEIGHTLGFPHEHQNPNAGIVWDEEAVYAALARPPNSWSREKTHWNIIRKINPDSIDGSTWDPNSVMHYPFGSGLILEPAEFRGGLRPTSGLSAKDQAQVKMFYPPLGPVHPELKPLESRRLNLAAGAQENFSVIPSSTRDYEFRTFGDSDTVMVLFEDINGKPSYMTGDDDSGTALNAQFRVRLIKGRKYILRIRLYYRFATGDTAIMMI